VESHHRQSRGDDGAVVVDKRFGVVGFAAEVSNELPAPARVWRALDTEGVNRRAEDTVPEQKAALAHRARSS
jgi:hypothetical protein